LSLNIVWDNAFVCDYRETTCTFYLEHTEVPTTFNSNWAGSYARKYVSDGVGGYTCIENCP
jgi:arabinogalactan endo-1,4-beta-galactosidase